MKLNELNKNEQKELNLKRNDLTRLQNLKLSEGKELMETLPLRTRLNMFAKNCSIKELHQLIDEYRTDNDTKKEQLLKKYCKKYRRAILFS